MKQFVTCEVDGCLLAIPIEAVQEVHAIGQTTPVRRAPDYVAGLLNLRGHVVTLIDLGRRIGSAAEPTQRSQNIVLKSIESLRRANIVGGELDLDSQQEVIGFAVDRVGDVIEAPAEAFEAVPANLRDLQARYLSGVVRLPDAVYTIVNIGAALQTDSAAAAA